MGFFSEMLVLESLRPWVCPFPSSLQQGVKHTDDESHCDCSIACGIFSHSTPPRHFNVLLPSSTVTTKECFYGIEPAILPQKTNDIIFRNRLPA